MLARRLARALLTATCLLLALPALAPAAIYTVNVETDQPKEAGVECGTGEECSLPAALELSNLSPAVMDTIEFDETVFEGGSGDTIFPNPALPTITSPVRVDGGVCDTAAGVEGPCVGVAGPSGEPVFVVESDEVTIENLSITGGEIGILVASITGSKKFTASGNWIGLTLESSDGRNANAGILLGPESDEATIGGTEAAQRNVFGYNPVGLDIEGASDAVVRGNWFGVWVDGAELAQASDNIEITNMKLGGGLEAKAEDNEIGAAVSEAAAGTAECDGGCNVISAAVGSGIDLVADGGDEMPASGPTIIHGNYVGLNPAGEGVTQFRNYGNSQYGILAGKASRVRVGGIQPGEANLIVGGIYGVHGENGEDLDVVNNEIGFGPDGTPVNPPNAAGIFSLASALADFEEGPTILGNTIRMSDGGIGIEQHFGTAEIEKNVIEGGATGVLTKGEGVIGARIKGNLIEGSEDAGIILRNPDNKVFGNEVVEAGEAGIEVSPEGEVNVSGNVIGGDSAANENAIFRSGDSAIEIFGIEASRNEVGCNRGSENGGPFIRLRAVGASEPGNGVEPPQIATAGKTEASGTAEPNARVRVFRKASVEEGEIAGFVAEAVADGSGQWKATYAGLPEGTVVTATQTLDGGTSELSGTAKTPPDPPAPPSGCPAVPSACPPPPLDTTKPKVTIKKAPKAKSKSTTAKFKFVANEANSKFKCKLDKKAFANCKSPKTYRNLKPGKHVFKVKATNSAGTSPVLTRKFTVLSPR